MKLSLIGTMTGLGVLALVATQSGRTPAQSTQTTQTTPPGVIAQRPLKAGMTGYDVAAHLSNQELAQQADAIVVATATQTGIFWANDGRNLYTLVTVEVRDTLKGDQSATLTVAIPGGIDANRRFPIAMTYPGGPQLGVGEEAVLFLTHADDEVAGTYAIAGVAQGKFAIGAGDMVRVGEETVPLAAFTQEIRGYLQQ